MKDLTICFAYKGVLKYPNFDEAIPHALPMLYRQLNKYKEIYIWDGLTDPKEISKWMLHHDMEWRQCCNRIVRDMSEDIEDRKNAKQCLLHPPLLERIFLPKMRPQCDIYVTSCNDWRDNRDKAYYINVIQPIEVYEIW